jgi:hypothetical protein
MNDLYLCADEPLREGLLRVADGLIQNAVLEETRRNLRAIRFSEREWRVIEPGLTSVYREPDTCSVFRLQSAKTLTHSFCSMRLDTGAAQLASKG